MFFAHIRAEEDGLTRQMAAEHCQNAARYAGSCLRGVALEQTGILMGLVHDCGKFKRELITYNRGYLCQGNLRKRVFLET